MQFSRSTRVCRTACALPIPTSSTRISWPSSRHEPRARWRFARQRISRQGSCKALRRASFDHSLAQHVIRQAVAVARLIGVPATIHMRQVEGPDGAQSAAIGEKFDDRGKAPDVDPENILAMREEIADVFRRRDTALKKGFVQLVAPR